MYGRCRVEEELSVAVLDLIAELLPGDGKVVKLRARYLPFGSTQEMHNEVCLPSSTMHTIWSFEDEGLLLLEVSLAYWD